MDPTRRTIHRRLYNFVDWIRPDQARIETVREQAQREREALCVKARADDLIIHSTPWGGSFAKNTGLRRHVTGGSDVEGLDVDLHFVVSPKGEDDDEVVELLPRFEGYVRERWPDKTVEVTKNSVKISFVGTRLSYDIVPLLATENQDEQLLLRRNGEMVLTSVQRHVEFVKYRTRSSNELPGRVKFNECVRLVKWWREFKCETSEVEVPSLALELLCAHAYDHRSVKTTYHETLADWCGFLADVIERRRRVTFSDFCKVPPLDAHAEWELLDAVNPKNNHAKRWRRAQIDELAGWFAEARDQWSRAIRADMLGDDAESLGYLVELFGTPIKHHCGDT